MPQRNDPPQSLYTVLLIDKARRRQLIFLTLISLAAMVALVEYGQVQQKPWLLIALCAVVIGLPLMALPKSESWAYQPWQSEPQKLEQHFRN